MDNENNYENPNTEGNVPHGSENKQDNFDDMFFGVEEVPQQSDAAPDDDDIVKEIKRDKHTHSKQSPHAKRKKDLLKILYGYLL